MIRTIRTEDASYIREIYNFYVENTIITFEEEAVQASEIKSRIIQHPANLPWIVYEENNEVLGYAYASEWKSRCAYKHSVESTVYLSQAAIGKGIGSLLYNELLMRLKQKNIHAILAGISLPNDTSVALHEKFGFKKVAHFSEVGNKFGRWIDVGYWELIFGMP